MIPKRLGWNQKIILLTKKIASKQEYHTCQGAGIAACAGLREAVRVSQSSHLPGLQSLRGLQPGFQALLERSSEPGAAGATPTALFQPPAACAIPCRWSRFPTMWYNVPPIAGPARSWWGSQLLARTGAEDRLPLAIAVATLVRAPTVLELGSQHGAASNKTSSSHSKTGNFP